MVYLIALMKKKISIVLRSDPNIYVLAVLLISVFALSEKSHAQDQYPLLTGPYMGQKPPSEIAVPFAPGIISKDGRELVGVFAPGMKDFNYTKRAADGKSSVIAGFREKNNIWRKYIEIPRNGEVSFSPNGKRMHMAEGYLDREGDGWSKRKNLCK